MTASEKSCYSLYARNIRTFAVYTFSFLHDEEHGHMSALLGYMPLEGKVHFRYYPTYNTMNLEKYSSLTFFNGLESHQIQLLEPYFAPQTWVAGTTVFEQGDYAEYLYLLVSGEVSIRFKPEDGASMTVTRVQAGGIFGWSAAMNNPTYTSGAVCTLDSEVLRIRGKDLR